MSIGPRSSVQRLELRADALEWLAKGKQDWQHSDGTPNRARIAKAAGLPKATLNRVANYDNHPDAYTVAALAQLGMQRHRVTDGFALSRICRVVDFSATSDVVEVNAA